MAVAAPGVDERGRRLGSPEGRDAIDKRHNINSVLSAAAEAAAVAAIVAGVPDLSGYAHMNSLLVKYVVYSVLVWACGANIRSWECAERPSKTPYLGGLLLLWVAAPSFFLCSGGSGDG